MTGSEGLFLDVAALLEGRLPEPPSPFVCSREDGHALFYAGQVNLIFGDPESGKSWLAAAAAAEQLQEGRRVLWLDLDHNGGEAVVYRLLALGAPVEALSDRRWFRFWDADDDRDLSRQILPAALEWRPAVGVIDSVGELMPILGLSSNGADDFTMCHLRVLKPLAKAGACVLAIDHLAKGAESRLYGPTGTAAKRRAIGGVSLRMTLSKTFVEGEGGSAKLEVHKDRHGGVRKHCPRQRGEQYAGTFMLTEQAGVLGWRITEPTEGQSEPSKHGELLERVSKAVEDAPGPLSVRGVSAVAGGRQTDLTKVLDELVAQQYVLRKPGPRGSFLHTSLKPYRAADRLPSVSDRSVSPAVRDRLPPKGWETGDSHATVSGRQWEAVGDSQSDDTFAAVIDAESLILPDLATDSAACACGRRPTSYTSKQNGVCRTCAHDAKRKTA